MIKVLMADDHPIVRHGLKQILSESGDITVVDEVETGQDVLKKVWKNQYDVVLLDISMPGRSGLEIIPEIRENGPKNRVLVLSAYPEEQYAVRALKSGASGYVVKKSAPEELVAAIKKVANGRRYVSVELAEKLAFDLQSSDEAPHEKLSNREFQVMSMIASGNTVKEIGDVLSISVKTVSTHRTRILEKMDLKNNSAIIRYAVKNQLVE